MRKSTKRLLDSGVLEEEGLEFVGEAEGSDYVFVRDAFGVLRSSVSNLLAGKQPGIQSAVDKNTYTENRLARALKEQGLTFVELDTDNNSYVYVRDAFGLLRIRITHLLSGHSPRIASAVDKNTYFSTKARATHGDLYDYSKVAYKTTHIKVEIGCAKHGSFWQEANSHLQGNGCPHCGYEATTNKQRSNTEEFIQKAQEVHGDTYDYSRVVYTNTHMKVAISCPKHGAFTQTPNSHLHGNGCPTCGRERTTNKQRSNTEEFALKAQAVHGDLYDYSKVNYTNNHTKVAITCPEHGAFEQTPDKHLAGNGCPQCATEARVKGFYENRPTILYIVQFSPEYIKIGITSKTVSQRFYDAPTQPTIIREEHFMNGWDAYLLEQRLLSITKEWKPPYAVGRALVGRSGGATEIRSVDALQLTEKEIQHARRKN